jgi:hypothetical protein
MGLREDPFYVCCPDPRFYYPTRAHESALAELLYGIETRQGPPALWNLVLRPMVQRKVGRA